MKKASGSLIRPFVCMVVLLARTSSFGNPKLWNRVDPRTMKYAERKVYTSIIKAAE